MNGKKFNEAIAVAVGVILGLCVVALVLAGTVKLILWMF